MDRPAVRITDPGRVTDLAIAGEPDHFAVAWQVDEVGELGALVVDGGIAGPPQSLGAGREPNVTARGTTLDLQWIVDATETRAELRSSEISRDGLGPIAHFD